MEISIADKRNLKSAWVWLKCVMIPAFLINYFDLFYGGYLWLSFVILAGISMAAACITDNEPNFKKSRFKNLNPLFWCKEKSWQNKYKMKWWIPDGLTDFWHISVASSVTFLLLSVAVQNHNVWYLDLILGLYIFWNTFSLFYDIIFRKNGE